MKKLLDALLTFTLTWLSMGELAGAREPSTHHVER